MSTVTAIAAVVTGSLVTLSQAPAVEEPRVQCGGSNGTNIETVVRDDGAPGSSGAGGAGAGSAGRPAGVAGGAPSCTYTALTAEEALAAGLPSPDDGGPANVQRDQGAYARRDCTASGGARTLLWVPSGDAGAVPAGVPAVTPALLAAEARNSLELPAPEVGVNPDGLDHNPALVNLPTWWWVENGQPITQRTAVGPVWAEVTAQPVASTWVTSDGAAHGLCGPRHGLGARDARAGARFLLPHLPSGQRRRGGPGGGRMAGHLGGVRRHERLLGLLRDLGQRRGPGLRAARHRHVRRLRQPRATVAIGPAPKAAQGARPITPSGCLWGRPSVA